MSIQKIRAYITTIEVGSMTLAAKQLSYTQSAISKMISDLEYDWGISLLTRNRSGVQITSEGLLLLPILKTICKNYEELTYTISEIHGVTSGIIRIAAFSSISTSWLPTMIKSFNDKYPKIDFEIINGEYHQIKDWIRNGKVDCGFIKLPATQDLLTFPLFKDSLVTIIPKNHFLSYKDSFTISDLSKDDYIRLKEEQDREISEFINSLDEKPNSRFTVSNDYAILSMVECGLGISVVHDLMLNCNRFNVIKKPFNPPVYREIGIAIKKDSPNSTITNLFIDHIQEWVKNNYIDL